MRVEYEKQCFLSRDPAIHPLILHGVLVQLGPLIGRFVFSRWVLGEEEEEGLGEGGFDSLYSQFVPIKFIR
jgi:hypothetical protein